MRKRVKVVVGSQGFARGMGGSSALEPIERSLGVSDLAVAAAVRTPVVSGGC